MSKPDSTAASSTPLSHGARMAMLTVVAMLAFAGNSLLCRLALKGTQIDAASFTLVRIAAAALVLWVILLVRGAGRDEPHGARRGGSWASALALIVYAVTFSFAYVRLAAGTGALLLFGAVQATMIGYGIAIGERPAAMQWLGLLLALAGLVWLVLPGLAAPDPVSSALMIAAGVGWGVYSLRGRGQADPVAATAGNFMRALPFAIAVAAVAHAHARFDVAGFAYAAASGALTSGLGYVIWYAALKGLKPATAATVQLSVPVITAAGGVLLLGEALSARLVASSIAVLGGIALVVLSKRH
ncbi:DMT family transporter [Caballeronia catudaia]|nr:DMT family transporter [Caballeronia catudaia]